MPVPEVPRLRLYVLWPPRAASVRLYVDPDCVVPSVTEPLYCVLPVPVSMACHSYSFSPVVASVTTCSSLRGAVVLEAADDRLVRDGRRAARAAQTTLRGARLTSGLFGLLRLGGRQCLRLGLGGWTAAVVVDRRLMADRVGLA